MPSFEIMYDTEEYDGGYVIVEDSTPHKACLDILTKIILDRQVIPTSFSVKNLDSEYYYSEKEIFTSDLISIMYLSNNVECPQIEYTLG